MHRPARPQSCDTPSRPASSRPHGVDESPDDQLDPQVTQGATTAAYGVDRFPTTLLIGRDGTVRKDLSASEARAEIEKLLKEESPRAK